MSAAAIAQRRRSAIQGGRDPVRIQPLGVDTLTIFKSGEIATALLHTRRSPVLRGGGSWNREAQCQRRDGDAKGNRHEGSPSEFPPKADNKASTEDVQFNWPIGFQDKSAGRYRLVAPESVDSHEGPSTTVFFGATSVFIRARILPATTHPNYCPAERRHHASFPVMATLSQSLQTQRRPSCARGSQAL
jgi:hypothetical protein